MTHPDLKAMVEKLGELPLKHHPGTRFEYSVSTDVLGYLVEAVSEQRFDEYLAEHIFEPLKMIDTSFVVPEKKLDRLAELYKPAADGSLSPSHAISSYRFVNQNNQFFSGGGGLCCTIDDYRQFCQMLQGKGELDGTRVISSESLEQMWTNQLDELRRPSGQFRFGLGFSISSEGDYAWGGAAGTRFWVNPEKNLTIIFMVQTNPYRGKFGEKMRKIVYRALEE